jgi:hypothetical protein
MKAIGVERWAQEEALTVRKEYDQGEMYGERLNRMQSGCRDGSPTRLYVFFTQSIVLQFERANHQAFYQSN